MIKGTEYKCVIIVIIIAEIISVAAVFSICFSAVIAGAVATPVGTTEAVAAATPAGTTETAVVVIPAVVPEIRARSMMRQTLSAF